MKIGIVTQPLQSNYGGILQNYALQQVLKRMGHDVWTVDYNKFGWLDWANNAWRVIAHKLLWHDARFLPTPPERMRMEAPLRCFVDKYVSLTKPRTKRFERKILDKYALNVILVGSDQVWRPCYNYDVADCFLKFAEYLSIKRVAYAASFGTDEWEFSKAQTAECARLAKRFDGISVREKSGIKLCREHLGVEAVQVIDPTLLLRAEDYTDLCRDIPPRDAFVFAYILDESEDKLRQIKSFAKSKGLDYFIKSAHAAISSDDTVELWLSYFRDAAFVITDSFHGTAFAINFNKDFYAFGNVGRGNSRFESLLSTYHLLDWLVGDELPQNELPIDWEMVNALREEEIKRANEWLRNNL